MLVNNNGMLDVEDPITVTESDAVDMIEIALEHHNSDLTTQAMAMIALLKLSSRFPSCSERIKEIVVQYKGSLVLELQQRSIELNSIIAKHQNIRSTLVERMPTLDLLEWEEKQTGSIPTTTGSTPHASINIPNGVAKPSSPPLVDLLDLNSDDVPAPSSSGGDLLQGLFDVDVSGASKQSGVNHSSNNGTDALMDLLSTATPTQSSSAITDLLNSAQDKKTPVSPLDVLSSPSSNSIQPTSSAGAIDLLDSFATNSPTQENNAPAYPSVVAFESSNLRIGFNFSKLPGSPQTTSIKATFTNLTPNLPGIDLAAF